MKKNDIYYLVRWEDDATEVGLFSSPESVVAEIQGNELSINSYEIFEVQVTKVLRARLEFTENEE